MAEASLIDGLQPGDHICWTFEDDDERDAVLAGYVRAAIPAHHKVIHFPCATSPEGTAEALVRAGIDVAALTASGQLELHSAQEAYLGTGRFDPDAMVAGCLEACDRARAEGYAGLRLSGDMAWAAAPISGTDELGRYEAQVNQVYMDGFAIGLCLYDERLFPRKVMRPVMAVHPGSVDPATDPGWSPLLRIRRFEGDAGLRLDGAVDLSNRGSLVAVLEALPAGGTDGPPVLDVTALEFADVAGAHAILIAASRTCGLVLVGASPQLTQVLRLLGADRVPGLVIADRSSDRVPA